MLTLSIDTSQLERKIREFAAATDREVNDVARQQMKLAIQGSGRIPGIFDITPPAGNGVQGVAAKRAGEQAIVRDLGLMGFEPVTIKGYRQINTVFGHKLKDPIRVKTKLNPKFADPKIHHHSRLLAAKGRRGRITRGGGKKGVWGGAQAFYADRVKFNAFKRNLLSHVGRLAAGWIPAALELGARVPAFILRHAGSNHGTIEISYTDGIEIRITNHFPDSASKEASATQRRADYIIGLRVSSLARQLKAQLAGKWK